MKVHRIVIVGGVAAGMSAATRARRMNEAAQITVIERGGFVSFANCGLPYHVAGRIAREDKLLVTDPGKLKQRFNIDVRLHTEAVEIDRAARRLRIREVGAGGREEWMPYDKLILATGASAIVPAMEGMESGNVFTVRSMEETRAVRNFIAAREPLTAVVVGGGFIGLEMCEALRERGLGVTVVEKSPHVLPQLDAELAVDIEGELAAHGVRVMAGAGLERLRCADGAVTGVVLADGREVAADLVIVSMGVAPNVGLAAGAGLRIGASGAIAVDAWERTSDADIYAAGDAAEVVHAVTGEPARVPLAGPANRAGRLAGEHAALSAGGVGGAAAAARVRRVAGTAIVKVFGLEAGMTGLSETAARSAGFDADTAYVTTNHHAGYYPGASPMRIKLVYERGGGRVLGAQTVGRAGVDKRLDVVATLLHFRGTIHDLADLDLAYAPQFGSAKDAIHMAAFVAENQLSGLTPGIVPADIDDRQLVDVRTAEEFARGHFEHAIHIPVDMLRQRARELDPTRPTAVICQAGLRGHVATRMLRQIGFADVVNVKGGWELAQRVKPWKGAGDSRP
jgi:NADPH-dependent 2,4-dienoyl-CoA reductase/sulfur reductase-like enzyme/rhodanese-related sulfurtransferase